MPMMFKLMKISDINVNFFFRTFLSLFLSSFSNRYYSPFNILFTTVSASNLFMNHVVRNYFSCACSFSLFLSFVIFASQILLIELNQHVWLCKRSEAHIINTNFIASKKVKFQFCSSFGALLSSY